MSAPEEDDKVVELGAIEKLSAVVDPVMYVYGKLHPIIGITHGVLRGVVGLWQHRTALFADELIELKLDPPKERIAAREFFDALTLTVRRVQETASDLKIKRFAKLFAAYNEGKVFDSFDQYDEYLSIVDELSDREFQVLLILDRFEKLNPLYNRNPLQRAMDFWEQFGVEVQKTLGIPRDELTPMLTRLQRTGLYEHFVGSFGDYAGGMGCVTPLFERLVAALKIPG